MTIGSKIAAARRRMGWTQEKLADRLEVTFQAVSSWERDETLPETKNLIGLARILNTSLDALIDEKQRDWELRVPGFDPDRQYTFVKTRAQSLGLNQTLAALPLMKAKHEGQFRKSMVAPVPYRAHPLTMACHALAMKLHDDDVIAAALAHDMLEDTPVKLADLPVNDRVKEAVRLVSKNEYDHGDPKWEEKYFEEILKNPLACLVKCLDRVNNLAGMADAFSRRKMVRYAEETDRYYPALLDVIKKVPAWNDAWWLLRYQLMTQLETYKRLL
jgi:GTP pyrophosphokinase